MPSDGTKPAMKKDEDYEFDDDEKPISQVHIKTSKKVSSSSKKQTSKVKKEEQADDDYEDYSPPPRKPISRQAKPKKEESPIDDKKKVKGRKEEEKEEGKKRQKKNYDLPGQKRDPPEERDPLRIFYETLYQQIPTSELAAVWMMESGLLPLEEATKVYEKKMKKTKNQRVTSPAKVVKDVKETKSVTIKKKVETSSQKSSGKKKTTELITVSKQSKKRKAESSEEDPSSDEDSGDDFAPTPSSKKAIKKPRVK